VRIKDPREWTVLQNELVDELRKSVTSEPLLRVDGDATYPHGPRTITSPMQLWKLDPDCMTTDIIVGDLDASFPYEDTPERNFILPPLHYCAPELISQLVPTPPDIRADVWSLALTLFMIRSGTLLFPRTKTIGTMFLSLHTRLGDSSKLRELWTMRDEYLNADGRAMVYSPVEKTLLEVIQDIGRDFEEVNGMETETAISAEDAASSYGAQKALAAEWGPPAPSPAEVQCFHALLSKMLEVDPTRRIKIEEVVKHPWFITEFEC
jgi:serine/threonine protein kinase